jgi:uncharacterized membrane protein
LAGGGWRVFGLSLFAIAAGTLLVFGWQDGVPWTAAAFVAFFASRVWRSVIKRPLFPIADDDRLRRTNRFIIVTAAGYLAAGACAATAAVVGEGQEWLYVAPCFLIMGALQLALLSSRGET